jgi:hypothetical protein
LLLQKLFILGGVFVSADSEHHAVARRDVALQTIQGRSFLDAWLAPRAEEIQHHDFAVKVGKPLRLSRHAKEKILRGLSRDAGFTLPVAGHGKKHQNAGRTRDSSPGHHFSDKSHGMLY